MSMSPPSPLPSTGNIVLTLGSARTDTSLTAPVVRSATSADWLSGSMIRPLVLSRQPCITPGAGHSFGNGFGGSGGGGGGDVVGPGASSGSVVNGCDCASSNRAQPDPTSNAAHTTASTPRIGRRILMRARLRIVRPNAPRTCAHAAVQRPRIGCRKRRANPRLTGD
jgi:hypothetical protein